MILREHILGNLLVRYVQREDSKHCELILIPATMREAVREPRRFLEDGPDIRGLSPKFKPIHADQPHSLVYLKLREDDTGSGFASGATLTGSRTMDELEFSGQEVKADRGCTVIETTLRDADGRFRCVHRLSHRGADNGVCTNITFINDTADSLSLELLTSFALNSLTPFEPGNSTARLDFHRFRSWWSLEGRIDSASLEALHLERSWGGFGRFSERFGQVGTMPVRHWFPTAAVEDRESGVTWAAQIAWAGSWQMELVRTGDRVTLCGGLADREFGHWVKTVASGESFTTPEAAITAVSGGLDDACAALVSMQAGAFENLPQSEHDLPVCFNEWCTSWGSPTHDNILAIARRLEGSGVRYIVIDDGWAVRPADAVIQNNGEWIVDEVKFPGGLKPTCDALREMGFIPGIWFEFEVINPGAEAWNEAAHMLQRDGRPLQVGSRRFWDFNDPWVEDYLTEKIIHLLRDSGIGYLKVDYNDNLGLGCDHADSLGEGLRQHVEGVQRFFKKLRAELPDLVIENCSSGGHRLEPSMQALCSMGSFSDAHEPVIIPMIARNLQRLILPRQSLVWAVLHPYDDEARLHYSLAATFLGRICLSGDIHDLADWQMQIVHRALALYADATAVIDHGVSFFQGSEESSYVDPRGWQAVVRVNGSQALVVVHSFDVSGPQTVTIDLPAGEWSISGQFASPEIRLDLEHGSGARLNLTRSFVGGVWFLTKRSTEINIGE